jgi:hypothetical protein
MTSTAGTFAMIFASMAGLFLFDSFLERRDRAETQAEARRWFSEGQALAKAGRNKQAVERFRSAVAIARDNRDYQLALANALLATGKPAGAESVANEVLQRDSMDGAANLAMARIKANEGDLADAASIIIGRYMAAGRRIQADSEPNFKAQTCGSNSSIFWRGKTPTGIAGGTIGARSCFRPLFTGIRTAPLTLALATPSLNSETTCRHEWISRRPFGSIGTTRQSANGSA